MENITKFYRFCIFFSVFFSIYTSFSPFPIKIRVVVHQLAVLIHIIFQKMLNIFHLKEELKHVKHNIIGNMNLLGRDLLKKMDDD